MRIPIAFVFSALLALVTFAQPTPQPSRSAPQTAPASGGATGTQGKIAIINTAAFRVGIVEFKTKLEALNKEFEPQNGELVNLQKQIDDLKNKVQTEGPKAQPSVLSGWMEQGAALEKTLKRKSEDYQTLFQKRGREMVGPIMDKINKFLDQYCQQRNIALLLERSVGENSNFVVWHPPAADITEDFMSEYNKAHPSSTPAGPRK